MCGDGVVQPGESCDDPTDLLDDGCLSCVAQPGFDCPAQGGACQAVCGDQRVVAAEACDDGNTADGDGCSGGCSLEGVCGNGVKDPAELCDQGAFGGVGCDSQCQFQAQTVCATAVDLETANNVSVEGQTWTLEVINPQGMMETLTNACGDAREFSFVYRHTVRIGPRPAGLVLEARDPLQRGAMFTVWAQADCTATSSANACSLPTGPARTAVVSTPVYPAGSLVTVVVASEEPAPPAAYVLAVTHQVLTLVADSAVCTSAAAVEPGRVRATLANGAQGPTGSCAGGGGAAWMTLTGPGGTVRVQGQLENPAATAVVQLATADCGNALTCGAQAFAQGDVTFAVLGLLGAPGAVVDALVTVTTAEGLGASCGTTPAFGCAQDLWCIGPPWGQSCENTSAAAWAQDFQTFPLDVIVGDGGGDGVGFEHCAAPGCATPNTTNASGAFLLARASGTDTTETFTLPELDLSAAGVVALVLRQHVLVGMAGVDVAVDGGAYVTLARFFAQSYGGPQVLDLTPWTAGFAAVSVRLWFQGGTGPAQPGWLVDDLAVVAY